MTKCCGGHGCCCRHDHCHGYFESASWERLKIRFSLASKWWAHVIEAMRERGPDELWTVEDLRPLAQKKSKSGKLADDYARTVRSAVDAAVACGLVTIEGHLHIGAANRLVYRTVQL